jgi:hypothetical protein
MPSHHTQIPIKAVAIVLRRITPSPCVLIRAHGHTEEGHARATWPRLEMSGRGYRAANQPKQIKLFPRGAMSVYSAMMLGKRLWPLAVSEIAII